MRVSGRTYGHEDGHVDIERSDVLLDRRADEVEVVELEVVRVVRVPRADHGDLLLST